MDVPGGGLSVLRARGTEPEPVSQVNQAAASYLDSTQAILEIPDPPPRELFQAIDSGIRLRRGLDVNEPDSELRSALANRIIALQAIAYDRLADLDAAEEEAATEQLERSLKGDLAALARFDGREELREDPARLVRVLEGIRGDVAWMEILVERLDGNPVPHPVQTLSEELERDREEVAELPQGRGDLLARIDGLRSLLSDRRAHDELAAPIDAEAGPIPLWQRRFALSRLQSELHGESGPLLGELEALRGRIADAADAHWSGITPEARRETWDALIVMARAEYHDLLAVMEGVPPARAAYLLQLARDDFRRLLRSGIAQLKSPEGEVSPNLVDLVRESLPFGRKWPYDEGQPKALRILPPLRELKQLAYAARIERQEKATTARLERWIGPRLVRWLDSVVLILIVAIALLLIVEVSLDYFLDEGHRAILAWFDLGICAVFLLEFNLKWAAAPEKWLYFRRHFLFDLLPSIPFGFLTYALPNLPGNAWTAQIGVPRFEFVLRVLRPFIRLGRLVLLGLRLTDRLVRKYSRVLRRNIVLFSIPRADEPLSRARHLATELKAQVDERFGEAVARLDRDGRRAYLDAELDEVARRVVALPKASAAGLAPVWAAPVPEVRFEEVIDHLIEMTPGTLEQEMGAGFAESVDRWVRRLDLPLIRHIPYLRELILHREQHTPAEVAALAANMLGLILQRLLSVAYYVADLGGTISAPLFLDRLGGAIVNSTKRPAMRLFYLILTVIGLSLLIRVVPGLGHFSKIEQFIDKTSTLIVQSLLVVGVICLILWRFGVWLRKLGSEEAESRERLVEAQFITQTRLFKRMEREDHQAFLEERVIDPELRLRLSDDLDAPPAGEHDPETARSLLQDDEAGFLRTISLLYEDFLEGAFLHRTDTRASAQLIGNPALINLRSVVPGRAFSEKVLDRLDLNRDRVPVLGGPLVWFNYITRRIVHETARLQVEYNLNAVPLDRLPSESAEFRERYRNWLAGRLGIGPGEVALPPQRPGLAMEVVDQATRRPGAPPQYETTDFTAIDFINEDEHRDRELRERYGDRVAELVAADRVRNIRSAFRSYPLQLIHPARRTINLFVLYETYAARGKFFALPFRMIWWGIRAFLLAIRQVARVVREVLRPQALGAARESFDSFAIALRKVHRMRKPSFMEALMLRAYFDVEYLGLACPGGVPLAGSEPPIEVDLDFIEASRRDRVWVDRLRHDQEGRLDGVNRALELLGWSGDGLDRELEENYPPLVQRKGEVLRALTVALVADHEDVRSLTIAIDGIRRMMDYAADPFHKLNQLPDGLPPALPRRRPSWFLPPKERRSVSDLFLMQGMGDYNEYQRAQIVRFLRLKHNLADGWLDLVLAQGGLDPIGVLRTRLRAVIARTGLWSEQVVILRTVQTLTVLDLHHYCRSVWRLGRYEELERDGRARMPRLPFASRPGVAPPPAGVPSPAPASTPGAAP